MSPVITYLSYTFGLITGMITTAIIYEYYHYRKRNNQRKYHL